MAARWRDMATAPRDGTRVLVKRQIGNRLVYVGPAEWRRFTAPPLVDPFTGRPFASADEEMAWMYPAGTMRDAYKVPNPTHWKPE